MTKKSTIVFLTGIMTLFSFVASAQVKENQIPEMSLIDALEQGLLQMKISGSYDPRIFEEVIDKDGVHFGKCMAIILKSNVDSLILLRLDGGTQLIPTDNAVQTMIVTHKAIFPLYPNSTYATRFYAMCGEIEDHPPTIETIFKIGELADSGLVKIANYLDHSFTQNMIGQHAVWAYTDQAEFDQLKKYGADSISIESTKAILNSLNLLTKLNTEISEVSSIDEESEQIRINKYVLFLGSGLLFILTVTTIILLIRKRKEIAV
ncbi:MAG: hypothetical protein H0V01_02990 [Bacteroidetes bacterium]|nr:hypothetical protein [Bacteroidota bacterium]HET6243700.1 hypothetical protein [Bacteroidia bacterium]